MKKNSIKVFTDLNHKLMKLDHEKYDLNLLTKDSYFTRKAKKLSFIDDMKLIISMGPSSIKEEMFDYFGLDINTVSAPGFVESRVKIKQEAFKYLLDYMNKAYPCDKTYKGYRLLAVDGSDITISTDKNDYQTYEKYSEYTKLLNDGKQVSFIVKKNALEYDQKVKYTNEYTISREEAIKHITKVSKDDPIISTTGKASRELFESRKDNEHQYDFLTVGSMGHSSSIALGVAINKPERKVWCIDGDGAVIMHMGALATVGSIKPSNLVHILINNTAHESVGGMPTVSKSVNYIEIAKACGYEYVVSVDSLDSLDKELEVVKNNNKLSFVEVRCCISAREDLGRPTTTAKDNKYNFMSYICKKS